MKLVVESGSTKANWAMVNEDGNITALLDTIGFNPFFHSSDFIEKEIRKNNFLTEGASDVNEVFFYGAGCESDHYKQIVSNGLVRVFSKASIHVGHDLIAAAYSTYQGAPCISCIIGTGSNSCYFDGDHVYEEVPALAYILGDEGSGSYYGKRLLAEYLYKKLPENIAADLEESYLLSKAIIFEKVYEKRHANVYLASFTPFVGKYKEHPHFNTMIREGTRLFLENHVCCYANYKELPVHFVGSIAYHFRDVLQEVAASLEITVGKIIRQPIEHLVAYHVKYLFHKQDA